MNHRHEFDFGTPAERLNILANLVELALYAPEGEVTLAGQAALQRAARQIVLLSGEISEGRAGSPQGANVPSNQEKRCGHDVFLDNCPSRL